jgi:hypothetical protein
MRVRHIVGQKKQTQTDTKWSIKDLTPRYAPIYTKTKPIRAGWQWRSSKVIDATGREYVLLAECNPRRDNWKAVLILETSDGPSVVARFEYHASHPGLHVHADCSRGGIETGAIGLDNLARLPPAGNMHRRKHAWTEGTFWEAAKRFFRVEEQKGTLI